MLRIILRWCWPCIAVGIGMCLFSAAALAAAAEDNGASFWMPVVNLLLGVVIALIGTYAAALKTRIDKNEKGIEQIKTDHIGLRELVLTKYHDKQEFEQLLAPITMQLKDHHEEQQQQRILLLSLHNRLDQAGIGTRPRIALDDGN